MQRPELAQLYQSLMESRFSFLIPGRHRLDEIYASVQEAYPELCDDTYLCSENCSQGHNRPEWQHRVRAALDSLKRQPSAKVVKLPEQLHWSIGIETALVVAINHSAVIREGRELLRLHKTKERSKKLVRLKKEAVRDETGQLACEVCGFDFGTAYGELGDGFAECHHRTPLASLTKEVEVRIADLAIVCANCHRVLHRRTGLTVESLKMVVEQRQSATVSAT